MLILLILLLLALVPILFGYSVIQFPVRRNDGRKHVACVGDSISYGCTLPLFFFNRYPAVLQRKIGRNTQVAVFAVNDRTLQSTGNKPYRREHAFQQSKEFIPETVVILLGTNDSKDYNWISGEAFRRQYAELISEYRALSPAPRIIICTPPCGYKPINRFFYVTNDAVLERIPEIVDEVKVVANTEKVELVDLYARTVNHRELFGLDGLHPNISGARVIADAVYQKLNEHEESPL